ncbi:MAG: Uma2 family endonuclease [Clostridiales bacterium]|nr:Uma2 family endonuclease [Clostridiales bacterium]MDY3747072.1 Uma2 family endonuclease [Lachnospiraceae bacterium]
MKGAAVLSKEGVHTLEDIFALPDNVRAELIDGNIYYTSSPSRKHQDIIRDLQSIIRDHIYRNHGKCKVYGAPFAVFLNKDQKNYVEPDISVICDRNLLADDGCHGAPDWIIEIVSPGSRRLDYVIKLFKYRSSGVKEYWIVDSEKEKILVWEFKNDGNEDMHEYTFGDTIPSGILENLSVNFKEIDLS